MNEISKVFCSELAQVCKPKGKSKRAVLDSCKCVCDQARVLEALASAVPELRPLSERMKDLVYNVCAERTDVGQACELIVRKEK